MSVTITVTPNTKQIVIDVTKLEGTHKEGLKNALHEIGGDVKRDTKRLIETGTRTGRVYRYKGRKHIASKKGEPPANRSGKLAKSGFFKVRNWQEMTVGEKADYAGFLEDGTSRMKGPREHLIKVINLRSQDTVNTILESVDREVKR
jgi:hypothetical protein